VDTLIGEGAGGGELGCVPPGKRRRLSGEKVVLELEIQMDYPAQVSRQHQVAQRLESGMKPPLEHHHCPGRSRIGHLDEGLCLGDGQS
jgi:hypothetical protein